MNISYNWLRRYIDLEDDAETVAKALTSIGLEVGTVEQVQSIKGGLKGLYVGEVLTCEMHPNSDHLHITNVNMGPVDAQGSIVDEQGNHILHIVCGAPNVAAGQKVIVATIGTVLYEGEEHFTIKRGKIRGEESLGMICAEDEIGVGNSHDGIIVLPAETPVGMAAADYYQLEDDGLIEVDITPNRSDAASHYGVARDLAAYYSAKGKGQRAELHKPSVDAFKVDNHDLPIEVEVVATDACPRYTGVSIKGVTVKESPDWLKKCLTTVGLRPINNIVDISNYILLGFGQPMHTFDADKIKGGKVIVKCAEEGKKFTTLDGVERTLSSKDLTISDGNGEPMCIAGVFGGQDSGVTMETKNVFLESAYFDPVYIRKTSRRHQLQTDASFRYERGCDPNCTVYILKLCALMIQEIAGGEVAMEIVDQISPTPSSRGEQVFAGWRMTITEKYVDELIGKHIGTDIIETIFKGLEIKVLEKKTCETCGCPVWDIEVPRYRVDVQRPCDVVEDILRIYGYNNVEFPEKLNSNLSYNPKPNPVALQIRIAEQLTAQGFNEILNNSLTKTSYYEAEMETAVKIMNPLSQDLGVLRQSMLYGGLETIQRNINRKNGDLKLYEFGNTYTFNAAAREHNQENPIAAYTQKSHLALWITGQKTAQSWVMKQEPVSYYTMKAYVDNILRRLGVAYNEKYVTIEQVDKKVLKKFDIDQDVFFADLDWDMLLKQTKKYKAVIEDLPKFPEVKRDFALLVDKQVQFGDLCRAAFETEKKLLKQVYLFDVYEGKGLEPGKKSYALSFILQDTEKTLQDKQIEGIMARLQQTFEAKFDAKLR